MGSPGYTVVKNGFFLPGGIVSDHDVVYDAEHNLVLASCVLRGKDRTDNVSRAPEHLAYLSRNKLECGELQRVEKRMLFLGLFAMGHYGHLLTEGIARYWYLLERPDRGTKIPTPRSPFGLRSILRQQLTPQHCHWRAFLPVFGIGPNEILLTRSATQAPEIIVPHPSMINRGEIFPVHLSVTKALAMHLMGPLAVKPDPAPVYLSRSKFRKKGKKQYIGEVAIEDYCKKRGCKIVYPEKLSLKEQVILFNTHDTFIGFNGSAFHSVMFRLIGGQVTNIYLLESAETSNFQLIDGLMRNSAYYIPCADESVGQRKWKVNYEKAIEGLAALMNWG